MINLSLVLTLVLNLIFLIMYSCPSCSFFTESHTRIISHMYAHVITSQYDFSYSCDHCCFESSNPHEYISHCIKTVCNHINRSMYICDIDDFRNYLENTYIPKIIECSFCTQYYLNDSNFKNHLKGHIIVNEFCCEFCGECKKTEECLNSHIKNNHSDETFKCKDTGKIFDTKMEYYTFMERKINEKKRHRGKKRKLEEINSVYKCDICDNISREKEEIYYHFDDSHPNIDYTYSQRPFLSVYDDYVSFLNRRLDNILYPELKEDDNFTRTCVSLLEDSNLDCDGLIY